ncbi:MAG TPA: 3-hydroxyacyl-CoA dehydrogenase/enoyl-CoA hydratase family protein [Ktedonobacterales bacterium]|nr:3-hydroxyacyl-CoA dehydrogenase/enoyl-CoA hydratase family protein [Ktedonobacterales bacterium]
MSYTIQRAAVVGAGIMGAGIAALLASAGIPTLLLDIVPPDAPDSADPAVRNRFALSGIDKALKAKPAPAFFTPKAAKLVTPGNTTDDLDKLAGVDWIIEAIVEEIGAKRDLFVHIERVRKPGTIISSNTSGLPANMLLEGRGEDFRRHFLISHFFNPVRFMKLLELVAGPDTDPELMRFMGEFCSAKLGKGVVYCKDRPSFIGNRIGNYGFATVIRRMLAEGYKIEEVDAIFGTPLGRPRSAVFRTGDLAGVDTLLHVADSLYENLPDDPQRDLFKLPDFVREMVARKWLGDKTGQGFYKKTKGAEGKTDILVLDPATMDYRQQDSVHFSSLDSVKGNPDAAERSRAVLSGSDRAATLAWEVTADTLLYTATVAQEISDDIVNIDNAMRWGFNWEAGPFQSWDSLGVAALIKRMEAEGRSIPPLVREVAENGVGSFYHDGKYWDWNSHSYQPLPESARRPSMVRLHAAGARVVKENRGASLIDLGDDVLGVEFHTKMNALDDDIAALLAAGVEEAKANWRAIVVTNDAPDFSVGANLAQVLMAARMRQFPLIERAINNLQQANMALKFSPVPVVVAPAGRALGGGAEVVMHGQHVRAAAETYIGLVEVGVGVIPAGGGCKEMLLRWQTLAQKVTHEGGPFAPARHAFEIVAVATVATSADDARTYGFLKKTDSVSLDRERLLADAKADALALAAAKASGEWQPPEPGVIRPAGVGARLAMEQQVDNLRLLGRVSAHDAVVSGKLAYVLTGGEHAPVETLSEQDILDLEREAFLSLCGTPATQARMEHTLKTGKPLRN